MRTLISFILVLLLSPSVFSQDDVMAILDEQIEETAAYPVGIFKATRIINSHSAKLPAKGELEIVIAHRFGQVDMGWRNFFGIDQAHMRIGVEYGIMDRWSIGYGRSNLQGTYDFYTRAILLRQTMGAKSFPFSLVWKSGLTIYSQKSNPGETIDFVHRMGYVHQLLIARKFHEYFSFQMMPTFVHRNLVDYRGERNSIWALGFGASIKASRSIRINLEYFQPLPGEQTFTTDGGVEITKYRGTYSVGIDIETGGHVFQIMLATNSTGLIEQHFIGQADGYWWDGAVHLGFNINRSISFGKENK